MKLIKEMTEDVQYLTEESGDGQRKYFIEGIIMQGDIKNRNGRMYPSKVLVKEMNRYNESFVKKNRAYGELGHPDGPTVNLDKVSHMFTNLRQEGSNVVGRAKILDTPMGKIVKNFIDEGAQLGISSRGIGSVKKNRSGVMEVQEDFMLATAGDIVADPSGPECFVNGLMEGVDWIFDEQLGWKAISVAESQVKEIDKNYSNLSEDDKFRIFEQFINSIS